MIGRILVKVPKISHRRRIFVADAHRDDGKRFVVRVDEKLTAFLELEARLVLDRPADSQQCSQ
jgi:hypothetical protein